MIFYKHIQSNNRKYTLVFIMFINLQHDPDNNDVCTPGGDSGNYIMYAYATSGEQTNNDDFSSCSVDSISPVLETKARGTDGCFVRKSTTTISTSLGKSFRRFAVKSILRHIFETKTEKQIANHFFHLE